MRDILCGRFDTYSPHTQRSRDPRRARARRRRAKCQLRFDWITGKTYARL